MKFKYDQSVKFNHPFYGKGTGRVVDFCKTAYDVKAPNYSYLIKTDTGIPQFWDEEEKIEKLMKGTN